MMDKLDESDSQGCLSFFATPRNWPLFYHTAKNMKARQLAGVVERKARHAVVPRLPIDFDTRYEDRIPSELAPDTTRIAQNLEKLRQSLSESERQHYRQLAEDASEGTYTFLNRPITFDDEIKWDHHLLDEYPLLWRLKLQAFEHLEWLVLGHASPATAPSFQPAADDQLLSWAAENPIGEQKYLRRSWIPHSVSLRLLNWSRYAAWREQNDESVSDELYQQIYKNALFLERHVEWEVGGNHLIENAAGLAMAGVLFAEHDQEWVEQGIAILEKAAEKQFLVDGGHFERSPMYHIMVLRRYLTVLDLLRDSGFSLDILEATVTQGLGFLTEIAKPDETIPLLNDSVYREQIDAGACLKYGEACSMTPGRTSLNRPAGSGYYTLTTDCSTLLIDVGTVGPSHLPAHSHNDQLSVLLWVDGEPLFSDTGVYDYAPTDRRRFSRSVTAHNTAQYEDVEPIPIGGRYLMGKRMVPEVIEHTDSTLRARYLSQGLVGPNYEHRRRITANDSSWEISDQVLSNTDGEFTVRYHLDPNIAVTTGADGEFVLKTPKDKRVVFEISGAEAVDLSRSPRFEKYGEEKSRPMITATSSVRTDISTHISANTGRS